MYITVSNHKGGVGKTTTAVHLAAYLQTMGRTLLIDGDPNRSATEWGKSGKFPFTIVDASEGAYHARNFEHIVIDTEARPGEADLEKLARGCDLLIIPTVPATLDIRATAKTLQAIHRYAPDKYRVLITKAPPPPQKDAQLLRAELTREGIPIFASEIPNLKAFEHAAAAGVLVSAITTDPRAVRAWQAYEAVGKEILEKGVISAAAE